jgi:serine/threonine protein phosphatase PrpC
MNGYSTSIGETALAKAEIRDDCGYLWIIDSNENDMKGAPFVCETVRYFLDGIDLFNCDLSEIISEIDTMVIPEASRTSHLSGIATSIVIAKVCSNRLALSHVGEIRSHIISQNGEIFFFTREHNIYNMYPESIWRTNWRYSERDAKSTILSLVGGGVASIESHITPRKIGGILVATSHLWHKYSKIDSAYISRLKRVIEMKDHLKHPGEAVAFLQW